MNVAIAERQMARHLAKQHDIPPERMRDVPTGCRASTCREAVGCRNGHAGIVESMIASMKEPFLPRFLPDSTHRFDTTSRMDGTSFKARLRMLGRTQKAFAAEIGVALRTVHYWASNGPPNEIAFLLDVLTIVEQPFGPVAGRDSTSFARAIEAEMDRLFTMVEVSHRTDFVYAAARWIDRQLISESNSAGELHKNIKI